MILGAWSASAIGQERAVTDSRGHVSGDRAYHAMGVSASAWRTTGQHRQLIRRVDPSRIVAVSNARPDTSDATSGAVALALRGRVRTPSFRTLKVGSRTEDPRRRQSSPHAVGNVPRRPREINTRANPAFPRRSGLGTVITSAATLIALGILIGTTMLFQSRGMPMAELAAAERACAGQTYVSDRERCMREWVAAAHGDRLAERQ